MDRSLLKLGAVCWLVYAAHWSPYIVREHFPAITLAEFGTLNVERYNGWIDDIFVGPRGGAYINNNPGASIVAAVPLLVARPVLHAIRRSNERSVAGPVAFRSNSRVYARAVRERNEWYFLAVAFLTAAGLMAPVSAAAATALAHALRQGGVARRGAFGTALVFAFGTPVFLRTEYLNHNLLVAHAGLLGFLLIWAGGRPTVSRVRVLAAGALAGFAVLCDFSGVVVFVSLAAYAAMRAGDGAAERAKRAARALVHFGLGALPAVVALVVYQWISFGDPTAPVHEHMPAIAQTNFGYRGMSLPSVGQLWANFFDPRYGLFVYSPILVLGLAAPWMRGGSHRLPRRETLLILSFTWAFVLFCAANRYSALQWNTGVRYLLPIVPALVVLSMQVLQATSRVFAWAMLATTFLLSWSTAITHARVAFAFTSGLRSGFELPWLARMSELALVEHTLVLSAIILVGVLAAILVFWNGVVLRGER